MAGGRRDHGSKTDRRHCPGIVSEVVDGRWWSDATVAACLRARCRDRTVTAGGRPGRPGLDDPAAFDPGERITQAVPGQPADRLDGTVRGREPAGLNAGTRYPGGGRPGLHRTYDYGRPGCGPVPSAAGASGGRVPRLRGAAMADVLDHDQAGYRQQNSGQDDTPAPAARRATAVADDVFHRRIRPESLLIPYP